MLQIPQKFQNDIEGKDFNIVPLVIIDDRLYFSTINVGLGNTYKPLVKTIGSIRQKIDINKKKFKISSLSINFYNAEYDDIVLSEKFFAPSVMNKKVEIYYMSQSANSLDDCLKVYTGVLKEVKQNANDISVDIEDEAETILHKNIPSEYVRDYIDVPDRYKNKRVPMVYGYVVNAPCVYYDIYETSSLENGSNKYVITPDNFYMQSIENPKVFDNDVYLTIRKNSSLFAQESDGTIYDSTAKNQYFISNNKIVVDKQLDVGVEDVEQVMQGYDGTPMAYNLVEVEHNSPVIYSRGVYDVHYEGQKRSANVQIFEDISGTVPSSSLNDSYLDVKDFGEIPEDIVGDEYWLFGTHTSSLAASLGYANIYGETTLTFEATQFASDNRITKSLPTHNGEKLIGGWVKLIFDFDAEVLDITTGTSYPHLLFKFADIVDSVWEIDSSDNEGGGIFRKSGETSPSIKTSSLSNKFFNITQRDLESQMGHLILQHQSDGLKYLKINNLEVHRRAILDDFISYDVYADVYGRVDNIEGSYTGTQQFTSSQRQDYFEGRLDTDIEAGATGRLTKRPAARQIAKPTKQPAIIKQKIKTRTKY